MNEAASDNGSYVEATTYGEGVRKKKEWRRLDNTQYEVSDQGDVRRGRRILQGGTAGARGRKYKTVCVVDGIVKKYVYVHQLVALAFLGPCPAGYEINHKDHNRLNNSVSNLEYVTSSENKLAAVRNGYCGVRRYNARLNEDKVRIMRNLYADGWMITELAEAFGVSVGCAGHAIRGDNWKHVTP